MKKRVLVVEDEAGMVVLLRAMLDRLGFESEAAFNAQEACEKLDRERFNLVLLDFLLGGDVGERVLQHIRAKDKVLPVIVVTAFSSRGTHSFIKAGATDVVYKPVHLGELAEQIRRILS